MTKSLCPQQPVFNKPKAKSKPAKAGGKADKAAAKK